MKSQKEVEEFLQAEIIEEKIEELADITFHKSIDYFLDKYFKLK